MIEYIIVGYKDTEHLFSTQAQLQKYASHNYDFRDHENKMNGLLRWTGNGVYN